MDKLNLTQTYNDNSLMYRWEHCRLIGLINKKYFIFLLSAFELSVFLYALLIVISCLICDPPAHNETIAVYGCTLCEIFNLYSYILWLFIIISLIISIGLLKMVYVNSGLRSTYIPTDGKNVKTWLRYHIAYFILSVMSLGGLSNVNHSAKGAHIFVLGIQCIGLMIEINVVHKFNMESKIAADRRNKSFEISNDI